MFDVVVESMLDIGFNSEEVEEIYQILAAVILIGDIVSQKCLWSRYDIDRESCTYVGFIRVKNIVLY